MFAGYEVIDEIAIVTFPVVFIDAVDGREMVNAVLASPVIRKLALVDVSVVPAEITLAGSPGAAMPKSRLEIEVALIGFANAEFKLNKERSRRKTPPTLKSLNMS